MDGKEYSITIDATSESHAKRIKQVVVAAVKYYDFRLIDPESRRVCIDLFRRNRWEMPAFLTEPIPPISYAESRQDQKHLIKTVEGLQERFELIRKNIHGLRWQLKRRDRRSRRRTRTASMGSVMMHLLGVNPK